jgi:membrane associated rhomboid family serine protease
MPEDLDGRVAARRHGRAGAVSEDGLSPLDRLGASLRELLATVLERAFGLALDKVESLAASLDDMAARGGPKLNALLGGARAAFEGRSPVWGAVRGAVAALGPAAKAALITVLILAIVLLPVTVLLLLLALIVAAVVVVVRAGSPAAG